MELLNFALDYLSFGLSIVPIGKNKRALIDWKPLQEKPLTEGDLRGLLDKFDRQIQAIAIIHGSPSNGWCCRDFDKKDAYEKWATAFPDWAKKLPTTITPRGNHVYFRAEGNLRTITGIGDGELRANGSYTLLPPSLHPSGAQYVWLRDLKEGFQGVVDPKEIGLDRVWSAGEPESVTQSTKSTKTTDVTRLWVDYEDLDSLKGISKEVSSIALAYVSVLTNTNDKNLYSLSRNLYSLLIQKGIDKNSAEALKIAKLAFEVWYSKSTYLNPRETKMDYWVHFEHIFGATLVPADVKALDFAWEKALQSNSDNECGCFSEDEQFLRLCLYCRELGLLRKLSRRQLN